jgi:hypothetical protein
VDRPTAAASAVLTAETAFRTPFPPYRVVSASRRSTASWTPMEPPDGVVARAIRPSIRVRSTSTVGLPRESRISLALMDWIVVFMECLRVEWPGSAVSFLRKIEGPCTVGQGRRDPAGAHGDGRPGETPRSGKEC